MSSHVYAASAYKRLVQSTLLSLQRFRRRLVLLTPRAHEPKHCTTWQINLRCHAAEASVQDVRILVGGFERYVLVPAWLANACPKGLTACEQCRHLQKPPK